MPLASLCFKMILRPLIGLLCLELIGAGGGRLQPGGGESLNLTLADSGRSISASVAELAPLPRPPRVFMCVRVLKTIVGMCVFAACFLSACAIWVSQIVRRIFFFPFQLLELLTCPTLKGIQTTKIEFHQTRFRVGIRSVGQMWETQKRQTRLPLCLPHGHATQDLEIGLGRSSNSSFSCSQSFFPPEYPGRTVYRRSPHLITV